MGWENGSAFAVISYLIGYEWISAGFAYFVDHGRYSAEGMQTVRDSKNRSV